MTTQSFPVAILAGGLATRLHPLTESIPKALVKVHGEPFLAHQLRLLRNQGIDRVTMCTGFLGEMIEDYLGDGERFGIRVSYSHDGPVLLGTGGAIRRALPLLDEKFFVLYGDSYLPCNYAAVQNAFLDSAKPGLMTVYRNQGQWDSSNVEFHDGRIVAYDKRNRNDRMKHIDYGLELFHASVFEEIPEGVSCGLDRVCQTLLLRNELTAFEVTERFYEVGSFQGIQDLEAHLSGVDE